MTKQPMGLGTPDPIGASPSEPDADDMGPASGGAILSPDTVKYHPEPHNCGNCQHMQGSSCEVIGQNVEAEGACDVWEGEGGSAGSGEPDADDMGPTAPGPQ